MAQEGARGFSIRTLAELAASVSGGPRWKPPSNISKETKLEWDKFLQALRDHEYGHVNIGKNAAAEISNTKCKNPKSVLDKWTAKERDYDKNTNHGCKTGASLCKTGAAARVCL